MPIEDKLGDKVKDRDDPNRCQGTDRFGQCMYEAMEGHTLCFRHISGPGYAKFRREAKQMYELTVWRARMDELKKSPESKSLGDEIAILRMTLEATLQKCKDANDLFMMSSTIGDLAVKIEKILKSSHSLAQSTGNLMDKSKAIAFASTVVEIVDKVISERVPDTTLRENVIDEISSRILKSVELKSEEEEE